MPNLFLFSDNQNGEATNMGSYRLYDMKIEGDSEGVSSGIDYVDYIIGNGTGWINTGIVAQQGYTIETGIMITEEQSDTASRQVVFSSSTNSNQIWYSYTVNNSFYLCIGGSYNQGVSGLRFITPDKSMNSNDTKIFEVRDKLYTDYIFKRVIDFTPCTQPITLLGMCSNADSTTNPNPNGICSEYIRLKYFKIYNTSNSLVIDLKPCLDTSGVPCMYDEISKKYFYNKGTGIFGYKKKLRDFQPVLDKNNVPCLMDKINRKYYYAKNGNVFGSRDNKYKSVKCLYTDGSSYINTGIPPLNNHKIELTIDNINDTQKIDTCIYGSSNSSGSGNGGRTIYINSGWKVFGSSSYSSTIEGDKRTFHVEYMDTTNQTARYYNAYLFAYNKTNTDVVYLTLTNIGIYEYKMWDDNETLVIDLIPCLDSNNIPCMYDKVSEQFFYNQGTGEFSYGIEELECPPVDYVEYVKGNTRTSTSIDTGVKFNSGYKYIINMYQFNTSSEEVIYGGINYNPDTNRLLYGSYYNVYPKYKNSEHIHRDTWNNDGYEKIFNKGVYTINGNAVSNVSKEFTSVSEGSSNIKLQLKNCVLRYYKVYDGEGVLIQSLKPCLTDEGLPALYDEVSKSYLYIDNGKVLSYGSNILGYTPINYIESNGTQYIDTGIVPTDNTDIDMVCRACSETPLYIMNGLDVDSTYQYNTTDTTVQPNLTASEGATLTLGDTNLAYLTEDEIQQAIEDGWNLL